MSDKGELGGEFYIRTAGRGYNLCLRERHEDIRQRWHDVRYRLNQYFDEEAENYHVLSTLLDLYWLHYELDGFDDQPLVADGGVAAVEGQPSNQDGDFQAAIDLLVDRYGHDGAERRLLAALGQVRKRRFEEGEQ